jgi:ERCC4-type nuclease
MSLTKFFNAGTLFEKDEKQELILYFDDREELQSQNIEISELFYEINKTMKLPVKIVRTRLDIGDYKCQDIIIERKTISDLINSIRENDRLISQLQRLHFELQKNRKLDIRLCIVGDLDHELEIFVEKNMARVHRRNEHYFKKELEKNRKSVLAVLAEFAVCGIKALVLKNNYDFVYYMLKTIFYTYIKAPKYRIATESIVKIKKDVDLNDELTIAMYKCIPKIHEVYARRLQQAFPSMQSLCNATKEQIQQIVAPMSDTKSKKDKNIILTNNIYYTIRHEYRPDGKYDVSELK